MILVYILKTPKQYWFLTIPDENKDRMPVHTGSLWWLPLYVQDGGTGLQELVEGILLTSQPVIHKRGVVLLLDGGNVDIYYQLPFSVIFSNFHLQHISSVLTHTLCSNTGRKTGGGAKHTENSIKPNFTYDLNHVQSKC